MANYPGLEWFDWIVLASSQQDEYAPWHSTRIMMPSKYIKDEGHKIAKKMC